MYEKCMRNVSLTYEVDLSICTAHVRPDEFVVCVHRYNGIKVLIVALLGSALGGTLESNVLSI